MFDEDPPAERRRVEAVHHDEQLVERHAAAAAAEHLPPGNAWLTIALSRGGGRARARARELLLPPRARLEDEVARLLEGRLREARDAALPSALRRIPTASISSMKTMHWPPHLRASRFALRAR